MSCSVKILQSCIACFSFVIFSFGQQWSDPINISNLSGSDYNPDFTIDHLGQLHCVWEHVYGTNFSKIFYSKSADGGMTWSPAENISLNSEKRLHAPHIVSDTENHLYVSYDYDIGNYYQTMVVIKKYDGYTWTDTTQISTGMPSSFRNVLTIDYSNTLFCFWQFGTNTYYRSFNGSQWGEIKCPFPGQNSLVTYQVIADSNGNIHCAGYFHDFSQPAVDYKTVYFKREGEIWDSIQMIGEITWGEGIDIDIDNSDLPHLVWCQKSPYGAGSISDSTIYRFYDGVGWSESELISVESIQQQIEIDIYNKVNIFTVTQTDYGSFLIHHYKNQGIWQESIVASSEWSAMAPIVHNSNNKLIVIYYKPVDNKGDIFIQQSEVVPSSKYEKTIINQLLVYPNPFSQTLNILLSFNNQLDTKITIYDLQGNEINKFILFDNTKEQKIFKWNGTSTNGIKVPQGFYLLKIQHGQTNLTKLIEYMGESRF